MAIAAVQQIVEEIQIHAQLNYGENIYDTNLWLQMTRWTQYLQDFITPNNFNILWTLVEIPLPDSTNSVEQRVRWIWKIIENIIRKSQQTVQYTGQAIRVEAVWSEKEQTLYCPLQVYIDADSIAKYIQP